MRAPALRRMLAARRIVRPVAALTAVALAVTTLSPAIPRSQGADAVAKAAAARQKLVRANSVKAKKLVKPVLRAKSERRRIRALMAVMRSLGVAVYTGKGKRLVKRASAARSVYLYDFEIRALAQRLAAGDRVQIAELAGMLGAAGLKGPDGTLAPATLAKALRATLARMTRRPRARDGLAAFVIRSLGLLAKERFDPARKSVIDRGLDPLQAQLLVASMRQYAANLRKRARPAARAAADCGDISKAKDAPFNGGLDGLGGDVMKKVTGDQWGKAVKQQLENNPKIRDSKVFRATFKSRISKLVGKAAGRLNVAKQLAHVVLLGSLIDVRETEQVVGPVHHNHDPTLPNSVKLQTKVTMLADLPEAVVKCGELADFKMPAKGGVPDVPIVWFEGDLDEHGTVECPEVGCAKTDADGLATYRVVLHKERFPGYGIEVQKIGTAFSVAQYQSAFGGFLGAGVIVETIEPKSGTATWVVTYHEPPDMTLRFSARQDYVDNVGGDRNGTREGHYAVQAEFPVALDAGGQGPLTWDRFFFQKRDSYTLCTHDGTKVYSDEDGISTTPGGFQATSLTHDPASERGGNDLSPGASEDAGFTLDFRLDPPPMETYEERQTPEPGSMCGEASGTSTLPNWAGSFQYMAQRSDGVEVLDFNHYYRITGWQPGDAPVGGEGVIARKVLQSEDASALLEIVAKRSP